MDARQQFDVLIRLLKAVVTERGGDPASVEGEYAWPKRASSEPSEPQPATSMSPLLTGSIE